MSKVLIDRAVLEATLEHAEFVSGAACEADDAIRAALAAKAQGVVMPEREEFEHEYSEEYGTPISVLRLLRDGENYIEKPQHSDRLNSSWWMWKRALARLNAAPVQQVSVPGGWRVERGYSPSGYVLHSPSGSMIRVCDSGGGGIETAFALFLKAMLAAAPAAPGAKP